MIIYPFLALVWLIYLGRVLYALMIYRSFRTNLDETFIVYDDECDDYGLLVSPKRFIVGNSLLLLLKILLVTGMVCLFLYGVEEEFDESKSYFCMTIACFLTVILWPMYFFKNTSVLKKQIRMLCMTLNKYRQSSLYQYTVSYFIKSGILIERIPEEHRTDVQFIFEKILRFDFDEIKLVGFSRILSDEELNTYVANAICKKFDTSVANCIENKDALLAKIEERAVKNQKEKEEWMIANKKNIEEAKMFLSRTTC